MLSGCATTQKVEGWLRGEDKHVAVPTPTPSPTTVAAPPAAVALPRPKPKHQERETKEVEKVAAIDPNRLIGLDPPGIAKLLGSPSTIAKGDPSLVWTYVAPGCTFQIFFYPDLKTASFHALKYSGFDRDGKQIALSQSCIQTILTARANG